MQIEKVCGIIGVVGGFIADILGGADYTLRALMLLMLIDIIAGFSSASFYNTSKYSKNGVSSEALLKGAVRKISVLSIIAIAVIIDRVMGLNYVRNAVVMYFIATEGISILEHLVVIGVPVPQFVISILENIKKDEPKQEQKTDDGKREYKGKRLKE